MNIVSKWLYLSLNGNTETVGKLWCAVHNACCKGDAALCLCHLYPLHLVSIQRSNRDQSQMSLFARQQHQQLLLYHILQLIDFLSLSHFGNLCNNKISRSTIGSSSSPSSQALYTYSGNIRVFTTTPSANNSKASTSSSLYFIVDQIFQSSLL